MARVLVLCASVGGGHLRAAQALALALRELDPQATVRNVDVLQLATAAFRRLYGQAYLDLVNKAPHMFGYFYDLLDQSRFKRGSLSDRLVLAMEKLNLRPFLKLLQSSSWDLVINTHFLPAEITASLRKKKAWEADTFTVTTDFETHRLWFNPPCEHFFTATEEGAMYLRNWGATAGEVTAAGIPIMPVFSQPKTRGEAVRNQGLAGDRLIVLQLAGGFGVGPVKQITQGLLEVETPIELVVVAGKNAQLKKELEKVAPPARHRLKVLGFTDQMDELMAAADLVVSKPGGLTTSEALARGAPMAVVNPIPGQESRNSDFLLENGAAIKIGNAAILPYKLNQLLGNPGNLQRLKLNARNLARPRAAYDVAQLALDRGKPQRA